MKTIIIVIAACLFVSCADYPLTGRLTYLDPSGSAKAGVDFAPGSVPRATVRVPIYGSDRNQIGSIDLRSGK